MTRRRRADPRQRAAPRTHARAFTLIEVLVALVIVTLGMAALMSSLSSAADGAAYLRDKTFAQWVALNQIALARLQQQAPSLGDTTGEVELANRKWSWKQTVANLEVQGIVRIDVSVRPSDVPAPKNDKDSGWVVTVSGVRGDAVGVGNVIFNYGDIKTNCENFGLSNPQNPYATPPGGCTGVPGPGANGSGGSGTNGTGSGTNGSSTNGSGTNDSSTNNTGGSTGGSNGGGSNTGGNNPGSGPQ